MFHLKAWKEKKNKPSSNVKIQLHINQKPPITNNPKKSSDFLTTRHQEIQLHEIPIFSTTLSKDKDLSHLVH
jgi:hypothetical protein